MTARDALGVALSWFGFGESMNAQSQSRDSHHGHHHEGHSHDEEGHGHTHGVIDPSIATTTQGIFAIKWSFIILAVTAALQLVVVYMSGSVALLADTIHNVGDATTAIPLWVAFILARRKPTRMFNYGLGRVEDLAGIIIVLIILASALVAFWESIDRFVHPQPVSNLGWLAIAGLVGFAGNEAVAVFRIHIGRRINSAALIADGYHARTDGLTSLAVVIGAAGVWLGFSLADPIIGLVITFAILGIVWQSARAVLIRMLDGVEPSVLEAVEQVAGHVSGIERLVWVRGRWIGHMLHLETCIAVDQGLSIGVAQEVAEQFRGELEQHVPALGHAVVELTAARSTTRSDRQCTGGQCGVATSR